MTSDELARERERSLGRQKKRDEEHQREWQRTHRPRTRLEEIIVGRRARKVGDADYLPPRHK